jgi:hypothetical protein
LPRRYPLEHVEPGITDVLADYAQIIRPPERATRFGYMAQIHAPEQSRIIAARSRVVGMRRDFQIAILLALAAIPVGVALMTVRVDPLAAAAREPRSATGGVLLCGRLGDHQ